MIGAVMIAATQGGGAAVSQIASWPLSGMGVEGDWAFPLASFYWSGSAVEYDSSLSAPTDIASLWSTALTAFNAAVSNSTACNITFTIDYLDDPNEFQVRMKEGSWASVVAGGSSPVIVACTSGTGSGFELRGVLGSPSGIIDITNISIALA